MIVCFEIKTEAKQALDFLMATGQFRDASEAISTALQNYRVLHDAVSRKGALFLDNGENTPAEPALPATPRPAELAAAKTLPEQPPKQAAKSPAVPPEFRLESASLEGLKVLPVPQATGPMDKLPPSEWIFGQFNKLLPVKATCRALLNLLRRQPAGIAASEAGPKITLSACALGDYLRHLDLANQTERGDALAAAFPNSDVKGTGSRARFESQFVALVREDGPLGGLPAAFRLVVIDEAKEPRLWLTKAGADFALLPNPVLDGPETNPSCKFSEAEIKFLLEHIHQFVPEEVCAYQAILDGIKTGSNTPDTLDVYLRQQFNLLSEKDIAKTFLTTQRTGAVSRMVDLGLLGREKTGLRVTYRTEERAF